MAFHLNVERLAQMTSPATELVSGAIIQSPNANSFYSCVKVFSRSSPAWEMKILANTDPPAIIDTDVTGTVVTFAANAFQMASPPESW